MKRLLTGILSFLIALAVIELLARAVFVFVRDADIEKNKEGDWFVYSPDLGWERKPGFDNTFGGVRRSFDQQGFLIGDEGKLSDGVQKKIIFIGDSNTFGNDSPVEKIFPSLVDSLLPAAVTINLAAPGYTSYQGKVLLRKILQRLQPDLIVVSFNYNDRRYVLTPQDADSKETFQHSFELARQQQWIATLEKSYTFRALRSGLRSFGIISNEKVLPVSVDSLFPRVTPENYRTNLSEMAATAQQNRIPVVFLLLSDNPIQTDYLRYGVQQLQRAQPDSAIETLSIATRERNLFMTLGHMYLAKAYRMKGREEYARLVSTMERPNRSLHGGEPIRLDSEYNRIMREVGEKFKIEVIDGAKELERRRSVYYDFCHFDTTGHRMIAELLVGRIGPLLR